MTGILRSCALIAFASIMLTQFGFAADRVPVFVSIVPQKDFVQQIGKDLVDVKVMVPPGANPAIYAPRPRQMAAISRTRLYFAIGVPFEAVWLKKIAASNPDMRVVHTEHGIKKIPMATHQHRDETGAGHNQGEQENGPGKHPGDNQNAQGILDPHIWLSPPLVMTQARTILSALQKVDPAHHDDYAANYTVFTSKIVEIDTDLKTIFAGRQGLQFMVYHPAWGYFAHSYGLRQVPIEIEGKAPKPAQLGELIEHARENRIKVIFVQPQFSAKNARRVASEIGGQVVFANPLAEDWAANLREIAAKFKAALR